MKSSFDLVELCFSSLTTKEAWPDDTRTHLVRTRIPRAQQRICPQTTLLPGTQNPSASRGIFRSMHLVIVDIGNRLRQGSRHAAPLVAQMAQLAT